MTNEELIMGVKALAEKLGRTPKKREFEKHGAATYRFGSWNKFIEIANLAPLKEFDLTIEDYKKDIHNFVKEHGNTPRKKDFDNNIYLPDTRAVERKLNKTWNEILIDLGYKPNIRMNNFQEFTDEEILNIVKSELNRIGSTKIVDYREKRSANAPSERFLRDRLKITWNEILEILGLEINLQNRSKEEWLNILKDIAKDIGRTPSISELEVYNLNEGVYKYNFGSYNNAIKEAGLKPNKVPSKITEADDALFNMYVGLCKKLGRPATAKDIDLNLPYKYDVFVIRFGGINNLKRMAGYDVPDLPKKFTKDDIKTKLRKVHKTYGRLSNSELSILSKTNDDFPSITSICRCFSTTKMSDVWKEIEDVLE